MSDYPNRQKHIDHAKEILRGHLPELIDGGKLSLHNCIAVFQLEEKFMNGFIHIWFSLGGSEIDGFNGKHAVQAYFTIEFETKRGKKTKLASCKRQSVENAATELTMALASFNSAFCGPCEKRHYIHNGRGRISVNGIPADTDFVGSDEDSSTLLDLYRKHTNKDVGMKTLDRYYEDEFSEFTMDIKDVIRTFYNEQPKRSGGHGG